LLQKLGYQADAISNGAQALKAMEHAPYALIFMEGHMVDMDGIEAMRLIREREQARGNVELPMRIVNCQNQCSIPSFQLHNP
jgi:CheY-like chemotaxis protein